MAAKKRYYQDNSGPSLTKQSFKGDADINGIVNRHMRGAGRFGTPIGSPYATRVPQFLDTTRATDLQSALNLVMQAKAEFMGLPARLRGRFSNEPMVLLNWLENPENHEEAVRIGLAHDPELKKKLELREARRRVQELTGGVEQVDLEEEAEKAGEEAPRADDEAQPSFASKSAKKSPKEVRK